MVNPDYPDELLAEMLAQLAPDAVVWVRPEDRPGLRWRPDAAHLDASSLDRGLLRRRAQAARPSRDAAECGTRADCAGQMRRD